MKQVEKRMVEAVNLGIPFNGSNTTVRIDGNTAHVFLHGNHIASITNGEVMVNIDTLMKYPTATTKSRLRALGVKIITASEKNVAFITYLNGEEV